MLKKVFGLTKDKTDILLTDCANRQVIEPNDSNLGQRYRNMKTLYIKGQYFLVMDDTSIIKGSLRETVAQFYKGEVSEYTASL